MPHLGGAIPPRHVAWIPSGLLGTRDELEHLTLQIDIPPIASARAPSQAAWPFEPD